jgi:hypothetical protein
MASAMQFCASPGPLVGGEKDEDPPVFLGSNPAKYDRNIKPRKITLQFDEFPVLDDLTKHLIISPPINENPDIKLKGKKVLIKNDKDLVLEDNTTYTYYFGDAICDLHETNPIRNFEFVFSTGPNLDSLSIRGALRQAKTMSPIEGAFVCLYKPNTNDTIPFDSLPYLVRPYYIARTNEMGEYNLNNLKPDTYLMFAIVDANGNYFFDMPNEEIAFVDTLVFPQEVFEIIPDSIPVSDSDSALMDSLWEYHSYTLIHNPVDLFMFLEDDSIPRLTETKVEPEKRIDFVFKYPIRDSFNISIVGDSMQANWYLEEFSSMKDSLTLWLKVIPKDTIQLRVQIDTISADTLTLVLREPEKKVVKPKKSSRKKDSGKGKKDEKPVIKYATNTKQTHLFSTDVLVNFETPLVYANRENMVIQEDSSWVKGNFVFTDSLKRNLRIQYPWKEATKYKIIIPQEALRDMFEVENDSIKIDFKTTSTENYGKIMLDLKTDSSFTYPAIIQLVKGEAEKEQILQQHLLKCDTLIELPFIGEGEFYIKLIEDRNNNGHWNSGHFGYRQLPESVFYLQKIIPVKVGWEVQEIWQVKSGDKKRPPALKKERKKDKKTSKTNSGK